MKIHLAIGPALMAVSVKASAELWKTCSDNVESWLWNKGMCGASQCIDDQGRSLEEATVAECGYPEFSREERQALIKAAAQACTPGNTRINCPLSIQRQFALFRKSDPIHRQLFDAIINR